MYSTDGISGTEAVVAHQYLVLLLSNNLKREYLKMCGFVRARMSLAIVRFNTLIFHGARDKDACTQLRPNLVYWEVMELMMPWRG